MPGQGYTAYTTPYLGLNQILRPDGLYRSHQRFGMYRWHVLDPIRFAEDLRVTVQSLGIGPGQGNGLPHRYRHTSDDIAGTSLFYLDAPSSASRPATPDRLLPSAFATGEGPDIFLLSPGDFLRYYNGGVLADLTPYMEKEAIDDFGTALDSRRVDGKVYALPMEIEPLAMFYAQDVWEKAGLSEADIPATWDQMLDIGDKLRTKTRAGLVFETNPGYYQNFTWYPWMWQGGGDVLDERGDVAFDSRATRQALQFWQDAVRHGIAPRTLPAAGDVIGGFKGGNVAMWQQGIWNVSSFKAFAPKYRYGVFKLPVPEGGKYVTTLGGWSFCANAQGRNPEAAAEFCVWALGSMKDDSINRMVDWCVGARSDVSPRATAPITGGLDLIFVLTNGGPANGTSLAIFYIYQQAFGFGEYGYASAMGSFLVLIMVVISAVIFKFTRGGRFDDGE